VVINNAPDIDANISESKSGRTSLLTHYALVPWNIDQDEVSLALLMYPLGFCLLRIVLQTSEMILLMHLHLCSLREKPRIWSIDYVFFIDCFFGYTLNRRSIFLRLFPGGKSKWRPADTPLEVRPQILLYFACVTLFFYHQNVSGGSKKLVFWLHCCKRPGIQLLHRCRWSKLSLDGWFAI
jgi:hypothetical protein